MPAGCRRNGRACGAAGASACRTGGRRAGRCRHSTGGRRLLRRPGTRADPFIKVGQQVEKGQTLCILEAMKMMNEIEAPVSGQVVAIEAVPGELVSFGQTLVRILPR